MATIPPTGEHDGDGRAAGMTVPEAGAARAEPGARERPAGNKWWTLVAVCLGTFMLLLDVTIVNVALPDIQQSLKATFSDLQWVVDAYALTLSAMLLTSGSLADQFGRRRFYAVGLVLFILASLSCGLATSGLYLEISRGVQGVGGAIMFAVSLALLADAFQGKERGVAFAVWGAVTGVAVAIGPLLGGALTSGLSWRWIFLVNLPIGAVALAITLTRVRESKATQARRTDWAGFVTFTLALASLVYALIESGPRGFTDPLVLACYAASAALGVLFVVLELHRRDAMLDLSLFRLPTFSGGLVAAFALSASLFALLLYIVLYIQDLLGFSPLRTGLQLLILSGSILVASFAAGSLTERVPIRLLIGPGLAITGVGLLLMRGLGPASHWTHLIPGFIVAGVGAGMVNPPLASTAVGVVRPERSGMASGINSTFRQIGFATGIALLGTLFATRTRAVVIDRLAVIPGGRAHGEQIATALQAGKLTQAITALPVQARAAAGTAARAAFTSGLDEILLIGGIIALAAAVITFFSIRSKDFTRYDQDPADTVAGQPTARPADTPA